MASITVITPKLIKPGIYRATYKMPENLTKRFGIEIDCVLSDLQNHDLHIDANVYASMDGVNFSHVAGLHYDGGVYVGRDGGVQHNPSFDIEAERVAGKWVMAEFILSLPNANDRATIGAIINTDIG